LKVAYAWTVSLGGEAGAKLLTKFGLCIYTYTYIYIYIYIQRYRYRYIDIYIYIPNLLLILQVAYAWAVSLGGEAGAKLLTKFGLIEQAIDYATESGAFDHAFSLANASKKEKLPEVRSSIYKGYIYKENTRRRNWSEGLYSMQPSEHDYATESGAFDHAFSLANASKKEKLPEVHPSIHRNKITHP